MRPSKHHFEIENKDGNKDTITSTLCEYGAPIRSGYTAMAKLVGIPCGVGKSSCVVTIFCGSNGSSDGRGAFVSSVLNSCQTSPGWHNFRQKYPRASVSKHQQAIDVGTKGETWVSLPS